MFESHTMSGTFLFGMPRDGRFFLLPVVLAVKLVLERFFCRFVSIHP